MVFISLPSSRVMMIGGGRSLLWWAVACTLFKDNLFGGWPKIILLNLIQIVYLDLYYSSVHAFTTL